MRGFHIYKDAWEPTEELLTCRREPGNIHDPYAVSMVNGTSVVVGHVPRTISALCSTFIAQGGRLKCRITGDRRYSADLPHGGLELPCCLYFTSSSSIQLEKVKSLLLKCPSRSVNHELIQASEPMSKKRKIETIDLDSHQMYTETSEVWLSENGYRLTLLHKKIISDGSRLNDKHINFAQSILKHQFKVTEGLGSSLYQYKSRSIEKHRLQIIHCRGSHWILASNMACETDTLHIYDSVYSDLDDETLKVLENVFMFRKVHFVEFQKQEGGSDCGLFAIAAATQLLSQKSSKSATFHFHQDLMRTHALKCFEQKQFFCFPN